MNKPIVIGVGGFARAGKDTFVKVARKILERNGYTTRRLAFADVLKDELAPFIQNYYGINVWTDNTDEKSLIRPLLVAHGCQKRIQTEGQYWIDNIDKEINKEIVHYESFTERDLIQKHVIFISDCRFPNEVSWAHQKWGGWFVHLKKYTNIPLYSKTGDRDGLFKKYDGAPNEEEAKNDPICMKDADSRLELENVIERELRLSGIKITTESLVDNTYLNEEIKLCLTKCPFLTIQ